MPAISPVLVVAAHPDDEVLGCGATIARLAAEGDEVYVAILAEGMTSRFGERGEADRSKMKSLHANAQEAARLLGVKELTLHGFPDNRMDTVPLLDVVKTVEQLVSRIKPVRIYTHSGGDLNIDHTVVSQAVLTATRPTQDCAVKEIFQFEIPSSTDWAFQQFGGSFRPNVFVNITQTLDTKIRAMACYGSESRSFPHPRSSEALRANAQRWGAVAGCNAAEAFQLVRAIV